MAAFFTASEGGGARISLELIVMNQALLRYRYFLGGIGDMLRNSVSQELRSGKTVSAHLSAGVENITL